MNFSEHITVAHPSKVNLVWATDLHISALPPGRRRDNYREAIFNKLYFWKAITAKVQGVAICGGDVFHVKQPKHASNPISLAIDTALVFSEFPTGSMYGVVGNHDVREDNKATLPDQPLNVAISTGAYTDLAEHPTVFSAEDGTSVAVVGFDYTEDCDALLQQIMAVKKPKEVDYMVGIIHGHSGPGGRSAYFGTPQLGFNEFQDCQYDALCWGHDHGRHEPVKTGNTWHIHPGSLSRAALSNDEVDRPIMLAVLSFSEAGIRIREVEVPTASLALAFHTADRKVSSVSKQADIQEFFAEVDAAVSEVESDDPMDILNTLCDDPSVLKVIKEHTHI